MVVFEHNSRAVACGGGGGASAPPGIPSFICKYDSDLANHLRFARKAAYCIFCSSVLEHTSR